MWSSRGIFVALSTPFTANAQQVNEAALRALTDHVIANGVHGIITTGSTGECASMAADERRLVLEVVLDQAHGRVRVVAHTAAVATREVVALSRHAQQAGAGGVMVVGPYYEPISEVEIEAHYATLGAAMDLPIIIYNHPAATNYSMSPEFMAHLGAIIPNIRAVKDTTGDIGQHSSPDGGIPETVAVLNGADTLAFTGFAAGTLEHHIGCAPTPRRVYAWPSMKRWSSGPTCGAGADLAHLLCCQPFPRTGRRYCGGGKGGYHVHGRGRR